MMKRLPILLAMLLIVPWCFGTTYYIDYVGGLDANNGTAKATPWKLVPGMISFAGTYAHTAGDHFILKGGVTWPKTALPFYISYSGTFGHIDAYTTDHTWYTGGSYTQPIIDGQQLFGPNAVLVGDNGATRSYILINDLQIQNSGNAVTGTVTIGASATVMTDVTKAWTTNYFNGYAIYDTTDGSHCYITANTATTATCSAGLSGGTLNTWTVGDAYTITNGSGTAVQFTGGGSNIEISNCTLIPNSVQAFAYSNSSLASGSISSHLLIHNNVIYNSGRAVIYGYGGKVVDDVEFYENDVSGLSGGFTAGYHLDGLMVGNPYGNYNVSGTQTGASGSATVMTDSTKSWGSGAWSGYRIWDSTDGSNCVITSMSSTTATCAAGLTGGTHNTWTTADVYHIGYVQPDCPDSGFAPTITRLLINGNTFSGKWGLGGTAFFYDNACTNYTTITNNVFAIETVESSYFGMALRWFGGSGNILVANNTFSSDVNPGYDKGFTQAISTGYNMYGALSILNNIFSNFGIDITGSAIAGFSPVVIDYNLHNINSTYGQGEIDWFLDWPLGYRQCYTLACAQYNGVELHSPAIKVAPKFVSVPNGTVGSSDFHLLLGSPAIGAGTNLYSVFPTDLDGNPRPATGAWDLGAYANGAAPNPALVNVSPSAMTFLSQLVGFVSPSNVINLYNPTTTTLTGLSIAAAGAGFGFTSTCGATLAGGASCTITTAWTAQMKASAAAPITGTITITSSAPSSPDVVTLSGSANATIMTGGKIQ
jgi:hypothetical protein